MKFSLITFSAALVGFVSAQSIGGVPACASDCATTLLPASCNLNPECICKDSNFISNISCCVYRACPASEQTNALNFAKTICTPVGVVLPAQAGCPNNSSSSAASSSTSAGASASSAVSSAVSSAASSASSASSSAAAAATSSRAGGEKLTAQGMGLVGAILGAVALL